MLLVLWLFLPLASVFATHAAGGELLYERVPGTPNTYRFIFKFYRDCSPRTAAEPVNVKMCYANQCGVSNRSLILNKWTGLLPNGKPNGSQVETSCMAVPTTCVGGTLVGYQEWWYTADLVITDVCDNWKFWVSISARNNAITNLNLPGNQQIYIEAMLNNSVAVDNNSPYFHTPPIPYCCVGFPYNYDNGAIDPDGDSLVFESIRPRTGSPNNTSCVDAPADIAYTNAQFNPIDNPFATGNTFRVDAATGLVSFTPTIQQVVVVTVKVSEYRNGKLIGYVIRDLQIVVSACSSPLTELDIDSASIVGGIYGNNGLEVKSCVGRELRFCFDITAPAPSASLIVTDDHLISLLGASVSYTNLRTDSVRGCVVWPLLPGSGGLYHLNVYVRDSGCLPPGFIPSVSYTIPINIAPNPQVFHTTVKTICDGTSYMGYSSPGTYLDTFVSSWGCDSIHTLELSLAPIYVHNVTDTICSHALPYQFGTQQLSGGGVYTELFVSSEGCDSTVILNLAIKLPTDSTITKSICPGESFEGYSSPGIYQDKYVNAIGCDSIRTIRLSWYPNQDSVIQREICYDESFLGYLQSGIYRDTFTDRFGCDSVRILHLMVHPLQVEKIHHTICPGDNYLGYTAAGLYIDTLVSHFGCDSVRILQLDLSPVLYDTIEAIVCYGESFAGYNQTGVYVDTFISGYNCDSIRTLYLTVRALPDTTIVTEICEGDSFFGYDQSGSYIDTLVAHTGCDSIRRFQLTVHPVYRRDTVVYVCEGDQYYTGGNWQSKPGIYRDLYATNMGCDSLWVTDLRTTAPVKPDLGGDREICAGESAKLSPGRFNFYQWNTGATSPEIVAAETGNYSVLVYDIPGCSGTDSIFVLVRDLPPVTFVSRPIDLCMGEEFLLEASGARDYLWLRNGQSEEKSTSIWLRPTNADPEFIRLVGMDQYGCVSEDTLTILPQNCCQLDFIPTAFTPNGDGLNDRFKVFFSGFFKEYQLIIVDRWGNVVFESNDVNQTWDGNRSQMPVSTGVYFYLLRVRCYDEQDIIRKGDVTVVR